MTNGADTFTLTSGYFLPNAIFAAAYAGALVLLICRSAGLTSRTWLLLPVFIHIALRTSSFVLFTLAAKGVSGVGASQLHAAEMCWLPALTALVMVETAAVELYICKGPFQERVQFRQLPMSMRVAFVAPFILLIIGGVAGLYSSGAASYSTNDGIVLFVLIVAIIATCYYWIKRKFLSKPAYLLLGTALLLMIPACYRIAIASGDPGTLYPTAVSPLIFECGMQLLVTYTWLVLKAKKTLGMGICALLSHQRAAPQTLQDANSVMSWPSPMGSAPMPAQYYPPPQSQSSYSSGYDGMSNW